MLYDILPFDLLCLVTNKQLVSYKNRDFKTVFVKLREREGQRVDLGRSLKGHLWMVDGGWWYTFP